MTRLVPIPIRPAPRTNGLGIAGFVVSVFGFGTCGLLCPLGVLLSLIALFRSPRGFAFAGMIVGVIGTLFPLTLLFIFGFAIFSMIGWAGNGIGPSFHTVIAMAHVDQKINQYRSAHGGMMPGPLEGDMMAASERDGWGRPLSYQQTGSFQFEIRSAGPDGGFGTADDEVQRFSTSSTP